MTTVELCDFPAHLDRFHWNRTKRTDPFAVDVTKQVLSTPPGSAVKVTELNAFAAKVLARRVRANLERAGFRLISRTDGMRNVYFQLGDEIAKL
jgi:hypothetical protein